MGGGRGAAIGGFVGAALGLIAGPAGIVVGAGAGAIIGGIAAKVRDGGFRDEQLEAFGQSLEPGSSFVIAVVDAKWVGAVQQQLTQAGAEVVSAVLEDEITQLLNDD